MAKTQSGGTTAVSSGTVNINANVYPTSVVFNNNVLSYTLTGAHGIAGPAVLIMNGSGTVTIANANSYSGGTTLNAGLLNISNSAALGTGPLTISGSIGAVSIDNTSGGPLTLASNIAQNWNKSFTFIGSNNLNLGTGAVTLANSPTVTVNAGTLTVGGNIGGVGQSLTLAGSGQLILTGANTYNSGTFVSGGTLIGGGNTALGTGPVTLDPSSGAVVLAFTSAAPQIGSLSSSGEGSSLVVLGNLAPASSTSLTIGGGGASGTFSGTITDGSAANSAAIGGLVKVGNGVLALTGTNTYSGGTALSGGVLQISNTANLGALSSGSALTFSGGTLQLLGNITEGRNYVVSANQNAAINTADASANPWALTLNGNLTGSATNSGLYMTGGGTLTLNGNNSLSGAATLNNGVLNLNGSLVTSSSVQVGNAAGAVGVLNIVRQPERLQHHAGQRGGGRRRGLSDDRQHRDRHGGRQHRPVGVAWLCHRRLRLLQPQRRLVDQQRNADRRLGPQYQQRRQRPVRNERRHPQQYRLDYDDPQRRHPGQAGVLNMTGGLIHYAGGGIAANWGSGGTANINVSGGTIATTNNSGINLNQSGGSTNIGILNLNGGVVQPSGVSGGTNGVVIVNFNGGTLKATAPRATSSAWAALISGRTGPPSTTAAMPLPSTRPCWPRAAAA